MSRLAELHRAEKELFDETQRYYAAIRRPWLEWTTFVVAVDVAIVVALRIFGVRLTGHPAEGEWVTGARWVSLFLFACLDTMISRERHPLPAPAFFAYFGRIFEKFAMQGRTWQLLLVLMPPITARLIVAGMAFFSTR
jgi:hypothetical protein